MNTYLLPTYVPELWTSNTRGTVTFKNDVKKAALWETMAIMALIR